MNKIQYNNELTKLCNFIRRNKPSSVREVNNMVCNTYSHYKENSSIKIVAIKHKGNGSLNSIQIHFDIPRHPHKVFNIDYENETMELIVGIGNELENKGNVDLNQSIKVLATVNHIIKS